MSTTEASVRLSLVDRVPQITVSAERAAARAQATETRTVETKEVTAATINADAFKQPKPLIAHEPQNIDASTRIESLVINAPTREHVPARRSLRWLVQRRG